MKIVPVRHPWRWVASGVILVLVAMLVNSLLFSHVVRGGTREGRFQWAVVGHYLFATPVLRGIVVTLELTVIAMVAGVGLAGVAVGYGLKDRMDPRARYVPARIENGAIVPGHGE